MGDRLAKLTEPVGGLIPRQVKAELGWEIRAFGIRVRNTVRPPRLGPGPHRLNIGAGTQRAPGWLTVDLEPGADIVADIRWRIPLPDASCSAIFTEHTIEHIRFQEVPGFFAECRRLLQPGAPIRVSVPDASRYIAGYVNGDLSSLRALHNSGETAMTTVNWTFHGYGHRFGWDGETLVSVMKAAGFVAVGLQEFGRSDYPDLAIDRPERAVESLYAEGCNPGAKH